MASMIVSVEYVEVSFAGTDTSNNVNLTKGQNYTNCIPFMTSHSSSDYYDSKFFDMYFSGTTSNGIINFRRYTQRNNAATIKCYVVEFNPEEIRVQQGTFDVGASNTDTVTPVITLNDINKAAIVFGWRSSSTSQTTSPHAVRGRVISTTSIDFYRNSTSSSCNGHWFLFEDLNENFIVTHKTSSSAGGNRVVTVDDGRCVTLLRTFLLSSYASANVSTYPSRGTTRTFLYSDGAVRNDKYDSSYYTVYWNCQIVEFLDQSKVYVPFDHIFTGFTTTPYVKVIGGVDTQVPFLCNPLSTSVVTGVMQGIARSNSTASAAINETFISAELTASGTITFEKNGSSYINYMSNTVAVDWEGIDVDTGTNDNIIPEGTEDGQSFVKSVENFRFSLSDHFGARVLSKGQDYQNCAVFSSFRCSDGAADTPYNHYTNVYLVSPGVVCFRRVSTSYSVYIDVSVVEFWPNQVKVQHQNIYTQQATNTNVVIEPVSDINKAFILSKGHNTDSSQTYNKHPSRVSFTTASGINIYKHTGSVSDVSFFVIEDLQDNFNTRHFQGSFAGTYGTIYDESYNWSTYNSFSIVSYASADVSTYPSRRAIRAYRPYVFRPIQMDKQDASNYTIYWNVTMILFTGGKKHTQALNRSFTPTETYTGNYTAEFLTHPNSLTCFNNIMSSNIRCDTTNAAGISETFSTIRITDYVTGTYEQSKAGSSYNCYGTFFLLDWIGTTTSGTIETSTRTKSLIQSVQSNSYYGTETAYRIVLTKGQKINQCVPFVTNSAHASDFEVQKFYKVVYRYEGDYFYLRYTSAPTGSRYTTCNIVEFNDDINVQYGEGYSNGLTKSFTIDEVVLDRAFLVFYAHTDSGENFPRSMAICGHFVSTTEIEFIRAYDNGTMYISWYVVECPDDDEYWKVQHLYETSMGGGSNIYINMDYIVNMNRSMFFGSWTTDTPSDYPNRGSYRMQHTQSNQIQFSKQDTTYYNMDNVNVEVIEMSASRHTKGFKTTFRGSTLNTSTVSTDYSLRTPEGQSFDLSRSIVLSGNQGNEGRVETSSEQGFDEGYHYYEFKDNNTVTAKKTGGTSYNTYGFFYAYQFPEYKKYYMEGYVTELGNPIVRDIYTYRTSTGELVDKTTSVSGTGYFFTETLYNDQHMIVCADDTAPYDYNYQIYGKLYPAVISGTFAYNEGLVTTSGMDIGIPLGRL